MNLRSKSCEAFTIVEALVYIGVSAALIGIGTAAMFRCIDVSMALRRSADDITRALHAGERWRADVRAASDRIQFEALDDEKVMSFPTSRGEIDYYFSSDAVLRRVNSGTWVQVLTNIQSSIIERQQRSKVDDWKWELELRTKAKAGKVRPLFTFLAVPAHPQTP